MPLPFRVPFGATPIEDASGLIPDDVLNYADLCAVEAENIFQAVNKHLTRRKNSKRLWFTEEYMRKVHRDMFGSVWDWAGTYRKSDYNLGVQAHKIQEEIGKLCDDIRYWGSQRQSPIPILEQAVRIHHRLSWIHPFPNGNGRHARMMADIYLFSHHQPLPTWPSSDMAKSSRKRYLESLRKADAGNFKPLIAYTVQYLQKR